jgi:hypothetical protein
MAHDMELGLAEGLATAATAAAAYQRSSSSTQGSGDDEEVDGQQQQQWAAEKAATTVRHGKLPMVDQQHCPHCMQQQGCETGFHLCCIASVHLLHLGTGAAAWSMLHPASLQQKRGEASTTLRLIVPRWESPTFCPTPSIPCHTRYPTHPRCRHVVPQHICMWCCRVLVPFGATMPRVQALNL